MKTLGERCLEWCLSQDHIITPEISQHWFNHNVDTDIDIQKFIQYGLTCAAAQSAALLACVDTHELPHECRGSLKALVDSAKIKGAFKDHNWIPSAGDLVIERITNSQYPTSMGAHMSRIIRVDGFGFEKIGASDVWKIKRRPWGFKRIIGYIEYPK